MLDFIRPEARAHLRRWSETLLALAVVLLGLYWGWRSFGVLQWIGWAVAALGAALLWSAVQRARFTARGQGPGVVQIIEGEIRFYGPRGGGYCAVDAICALSLSADGGYWLIEAEAGEILVIPRAATGAGALFDVFARLPDLDMEHLLRVVAQENAPRARLIWRRASRSLLT